MSNTSSYREQILQLLKQNPGQSYNKSEFARTLHIHHNKRADMRRAILALEKEGIIQIGRRARYSLTAPQDASSAPATPVGPKTTLRRSLTQRSDSGAKRKKLTKAEKKAEKRQRPAPQDALVGTIRLLGSGHGRLTLDDPHPSGQSYVHIPAGKTGTALTGDQCLVHLEARTAPEWMRHSKKGRERFKKQAQQRPNELVGRVSEVLTRTAQSLVGTVFKKNGRYYAETDSPSLPKVIQIQTLNGAKPKQTVVMDLVQWDLPHLPPVADVTEILGYHDEPGVDILGIIHRHNLPLDFPPEVQAEADRTPSSIPADETATRYDCRALPICTIDPHDARDHDDAVWVQRLEQDGQHLGWKLQVHIADVSHYVKPHTDLDKEALKRGNSTYLVDRVIPMLPTVLSNGLCSLVPDEDRLTKCAEITFDPQGKITKSTFHSAIIRSAARLSYEDAQSMIDDPQLVHPLADDVREAWKLASLLRRKRFANGALDLEFPEYRMNMTDTGQADGYRMSEHTESHQLIEEYMLIANEAVALALKNKQRPAVYRVHEDPDYDKLQEFGEMASILGFQSGDLTSKHELQRLIHQLSGTPSEQSLKLNLLKSLKRATYSPEPLGHYGLAKENYTHFTSPIRRYADLLVHRALQPLLQNPPASIDKVPKGPALVEMADHISTTERTSAEAEMDSKRLKLLEWLDTQAVGGDLTLDTAPSFAAVVTDVRSLGLMIELKDTMLRGVIKQADFPPGHWQIDNHNKRFTRKGKGGTRKIGLADHITVKVKHVDLDRLRVDFYLVL